MIFLDTSAIYALADRDDNNHRQAKRIAAMLDSGGDALTHNYILVESAALIQRRLGFSQAKIFFRESLAFQIVWVDAILHARAVSYWQSQKGSARSAGPYSLEEGKRNISFVDCVSFMLMRDSNIKKAFAFDQDFVNAGFEVVS